MITEITEQYLKVIFKLTEEGGVAKTTDIAASMDIAPASVTEMLHKLAGQGYVKHTAYKGAVLTPKGRRVAKKIARKHRLLERFLSDIVGIRGASGHEQACKMEHVLSDEAEQNLCKILNHPEECPHGRKIPKCDLPISCEKCTESDVSLADIGEGDSAVVSHVACENKDELCELLAMGFVPGSRVTVEKRVPMGGPIIVSLKGTKVAIARDRGKILHVSRAA
jgi:DtxR family Mn-dependent transcriptional regulator